MYIEAIYMIEEFGTIFIIISHITKQELARLCKILTQEN